jgi:lipopolysaccharide export system permease protein
MKGARRPLRLLGLETRYVARLYALHIGVVLVLILALVLGLDVAGQFDRVMTAQGRVALPEGGARLAYYAALRLGYNLSAILPIALAIGILLAEVRMARSNERAMLANTGRAPSLSLVPALLVGLAVGAVQYTLLAHVRPYAVAAQGEAGFRDYGPRFQGGITAPIWFDIDGTLLKTQIAFTPAGPELLNLRMFRFDADSGLVQQIWAAHAQPLNNGLALTGPSQVWPRDPGSGPLDHIAIAINPDWLAYAGVPPRFVPQAVLTRILTDPVGVPNSANYQAIAQERWAAVALCVAIAAVMATLCLLLLGPRMRLFLPLAIAVAGYGTHVAGNIILTLGEFGRLPPLIAAWALPIALLVAVALFVLWFEARVRRKLAGLSAVQ